MGSSSEESEQEKVPDTFKSIECASTPIPVHIFIS